MRSAVDALASAGWTRLGDFDEAGSARPWFQRGDCRCIVGRNVTTVYQLVRPTRVGFMASVPTEDVRAVRRLLTKAGTGVELLR